MVQQAILMSRINAIASIIATTLLLAATATAQVPETMSFQGEVSTGCQNCTQNLTFKIYNAATGGTALWNETQSVVMSSRRFNVVLGSNTALSIGFDEQYYLGITIGTGAELTPRVKLTSAPYALRARYADNVELADGSVTTGKLANGAVTDAKVASGISYSKLTGVPTSLPPNGSAGGDLTGSYPNPTIADGAVTDAKISGMAWSKITGAPTSFAASGSAGGDLTGSYPNPMIADNAVTSGKIANATITDSDISETAAIAYSKLSLSGSIQFDDIADDAITSAKILDRTITDSDISDSAGIAYTKLSGTPTSLPPSGAAGGDLMGNYPNPVIDSGAVTTAKIADEAVTDAKVASGISYSKLSGTPASLPPSGSAGGDLGSTYPNPTVVKIQGRAVASITPTNGQALKWNSTSSQWTPGADDNVPAGGMIMGAIPTAPSGYQYTGLSMQFDAEVWVTKSSSGFTARSSHTAAAVNGKIYVMGGNYSSILNTNEEYDPVTNTWATKSSSGFTARIYATAATVNGKIYVMGGYNGSTILNTNEEYDPAANTWATKSSSGFTARAYLAAAAVNGKIYVVGGYNGGAMNTNEEYDPATNTWATKSSNGFTGRGGHAAVEVNGKIYAIGGSYGSTLLNTNEEYDPATNAWATKSSSGLTPRFRLTAGAVNGRIYVMGGYNGNAMNTNEEYNPATNAWVTKSSSGFTARYGHTAAVDNGKIYVMGGTTTDTIVNTNEAYMPGSMLYVYVKQ